MNVYMDATVGRESGEPARPCENCGSTRESEDDRYRLAQPHHNAYRLGWRFARICGPCWPIAADVLGRLL